jgi:hypothetical protein
LKNVLYNETDQRWEIITEPGSSLTRMGLAISWNWKGASPRTDNLLSLTRTIVDSTYREATEKNLQLLIVRIFTAKKINVWNNVKWDS